MIGLNSEMLAVVTLTLIAALAGCALAPKYVIDKNLHYGVGISILFGFGAMLSNFTGAAAGVSFVYVIAISSITMMVRMKIDTHFRDLVWGWFKERFLTLMGVSLFLSFIIDLQNIDFGTRNFDAYYATQDGLFLANHASNQSNPNASELLPLDWSASTHDRYGVSYLIALLNVLRIGNSWSNAQFVMLFCTIALIVTLFAFLKAVLNLAKDERYFVYTLVSISPAILVSIQYFMFGQMLGLTIAITFMSLVYYQEASKPRILFTLFVASTLMVIYPAMIFPVAIFWLAFIVYSNRSSAQTLVRLIPYSVLSVLLYILLLFGFNLSILGKRIWIWLAGSLLGSANVDETLQFQTQVFGQFASKIGLPLYLGILRYPFVYPVGALELALLVILSLSFVSLFILSVLKLKDETARHVLLAFTSSWILMALAAYLKGSAYLFLKFSTWTMPIILGVVATVIYRYAKGLNFSKLKTANAIVLLSTISIIISFTVSSDYIKNLKTWNSFPQVPAPKDYEKYNNFKIAGKGRIAVVSPTAEEAAWSVGVLSSVDQSRFSSLGATRQALGEGLARECQLNFAQLNWKKFGYLLENKRKIDVVEAFDIATTFSVGDYKVSEAQKLTSGIVLNGGGLFPPTIMTSYNGRKLPMKSFRWSSGQVCLGIFSKEPTKIQLDIEFEFGPDLIKEQPWQIKVNGTRDVSVMASHKIRKDLYLKKGWNSIQVSQNGCGRKVSSKGFWEARADDRQLCFAVFQVKI
jgi:hypothetical protein